MLATQICPDRAAVAATAIMAATTAKKAEARLGLELDYGNTVPAAQDSAPRLCLQPVTGIGDQKPGRDPCDKDGK